MIREWFSPFPYFLLPGPPGLSRTVKSSQVLPRTDERWVVMKSDTTLYAKWESVSGSN